MKAKRKLSKIVRLVIQFRLRLFGPQAQRRRIHFDCCGLGVYVLCSVRLNVCGIVAPLALVRPLCRLLRLCLQDTFFFTCDAVSIVLAPRFLILAAIVLSLGHINWLWHLEPSPPHFGGSRMTVLAQAGELKSIRY